MHSKSYEGDVEGRRLGLPLALSSRPRGHVPRRRPAQHSQTGVNDSHSGRAGKAGGEEETPDAEEEDPLKAGGKGGGKNRYDGCYIDASIAIFIDPNQISWLGASTARYTCNA